MKERCVSVSMTAKFTARRSVKIWVSISDCESDVLEIKIFDHLIRNSDIN